MSFVSGLAADTTALMQVLKTQLDGLTDWTTTIDTGARTFGARCLGTESLFGTTKDIGFGAAWTTVSTMSIRHYHGLAAQAADESGNGVATNSSDGTVDDERHAFIDPTTGDFRYWIFSTDDYFYMVTEFTPDNIVVVGAGMLVKENDFVGGEFVFGNRRHQSGGQTAFDGAGHTQLLDGRPRGTDNGDTMELQAATIHLEGLDDEPTSSKYGVCMGGVTGPVNNDRQSGTPRGRTHILGGYGAGHFARPFSSFQGTLQKASNPLWPIVQMHLNTTPVNDQLAIIGTMPDIFGCNIAGYPTDGTELVDGGETYVLFGHNRSAGAGNQYTGNQGFAIRKVV